MTRRTFARACARTLTPIGATLLVATATLAAPSAHAATTVRTTTSATTTSSMSRTASSARTVAIQRGLRAVSIASSRRGDPYVYGGAGPTRFDCSGLTKWTFAHLGRSLPHSAAAQWGMVRHLYWRDRRPGDLVFFHDGGGVYHVAIYAGHNQVWHAPYPGARVRLERIWTASVWYGRVR